MVIILLGCIGLFLLSFFLPFVFELIFSKDEIILKTPKITFSGILFAGLLTPIFEELFFRAIILKALYDKYGKTSALLLSSFMFALFHVFTDNGLLLMFIAGIFLGYLFVRGKSIFLNIMAHSFINLVSLLFSPVLASFLVNTKNNFDFISFTGLIIAIVLLFIFLGVKNIM